MKSLAIEKKSISVIFSTSTRPEPLPLMTPPIKKRAIALMDDDDDSSSCPSFESPEPCKSEDDEDDDFRVESKENRIGSTFHVPSLNDSQEDASSVLDSPLMCMATQPPTTEKQKLASTKRRKVSTSPKDSLARQPPLRKSPRQHKAASSTTVDSIVIADDDDDHPVLVEKTDKNASSGRKQQDGTSSTKVSKVYMVESATIDKGLLSSVNVPTADEDSPPISTAEKTSLKTTLFPGSQQESTEITKSKVASKVDQSKATSKPRATASNSKGEVVAKKQPSAEKSNDSAVGSKTSTTKGKKGPAKKSSNNIASEPDQASKIVSTKKKKGSDPESKAGTDTNKKAPSSELAAAASKAPAPLDKPATESNSQKKKQKQSFQDQLLNLLFMTCKPYMVKTLAQELKTNEASVNFCLLSLVDKGWVVKKEFASKSGNRSKELYWGNQEAKAKELLDALSLVPPHEIEEARQELGRLKNEHASLSRELAEGLKVPSNADLDKQVQERESEVQELERRLHHTHSRVQEAQQGGGKGSTGINHLRGAGQFGAKRKLPPSKPQSSKRLKKQINNMRMEWIKRKEKCMDFIEQLADGMEKKVKDVVKLLELETDEMVGVKIPPKHNDDI